MEYEAHEASFYLCSLICMFFFPLPPFKLFLNTILFVFYSLSIVFCQFSLYTFLLSCSPEKPVGICCLWFSPRHISHCTTQQRSRKVDRWCCSRLQLNRLVKSPSTNHSTLDHSYLNYCCWKWSLNCLWLAARRVDSVQCSHFQPWTGTNIVIILLKSNTVWFLYDNLSLL